MATLLTAQSSDAAGSGAEHTGPCTVIVQANSVFDGADVTIEIADSDTAAEYAAIQGAVFKTAGAVAINGRGTYWLRAVVANSGSTTSLNCTTTQ